MPKIPTLRLPTDEGTHPRGTGSCGHQRKIDPCNPSPFIGLRQPELLYCAISNSILTCRPTQLRRRREQERCHRGLSHPRSVESWSQQMESYPLDIGAHERELY